jgi:ATP-dependent Zn protease
MISNPHLAWVGVRRHPLQTKRVSPCINFRDIYSSVEEARKAAIHENVLS